MEEKNRQSNQWQSRRRTLSNALEALYTNAAVSIVSGQLYTLPSLSLPSLSASKELLCPSFETQYWSDNS